MGSVTVKTKETVGDASYESEYIFSDSVDFLAFKADKREQLMNIAQSFNNLTDMFGSPLEDDFQSNTEDLEGDEEGDKIVDIKVGKKKPTPTKH